VVNTWLQDMTRLHALRLSEALGRSPQAAQDVLTGLSRQLGRLTPDLDHAQLMAEALMKQVVGREALTLAFDDVFRLMAYVFVAALVMVPLCRPPRGMTSPTDAH